MVPGCSGMAGTVTFTVLEAPGPHTLFAVTEIVPPVGPAVAAIDVDVELPLHPDGNVQVYDAASGTSAIL